VTLSLGFRPGSCGTFPLDELSQKKKNKLPPSAGEYNHNKTPLIIIQEHKNGDSLPRLHPGVPDLLQLLQPAPAAQAPGLPPHVLLGVPDPDAQQPEGDPVPVVPRRHQAAAGPVRLPAAGRPRRRRRPARLRAHAGLHPPAQQRLLHAAAARLQGAGGGAGLPLPARRPAAEGRDGVDRARAAAAGPGDGAGGDGGGAGAGRGREEGNGPGGRGCGGEGVHVVRRVHGDPGGVRAALPAGHRAAQHVLHLQTLHCHLLRLR